MTPEPRRPVITLTTDFGTSDHYAGTLKGVLLSRCPDAVLVDISHEIPPFSIYAGAYALDQAARYFPPGTVHLVVVDPGVGTSRRAIAAEASGQTFVAPDNGVLSLILHRSPAARVHEITNPKLWFDRPSNTFHGRDIFAPVAAALAARTSTLDDVGPACDSFERLPDLLPRSVSDGVLAGRVFSVDRFGNVITNFATAQMLPGEFTIEAGSQNVCEIRRTFGEAVDDVCFAYCGSSGYVELGMNQKSAAEYLGIAPGDPVNLRRLPS